MVGKIQGFLKLGLVYGQEQVSERKNAKWKHMVYKYPSSLAYLLVSQVKRLL